jgi:3-deoxy-D-manno-octulosonate 8-phosphate phosphatase (KDO 8-P phosphatase)
MSPIVERRARELGVARLHQGVRDKATVLQEIARDAELTLEQIAYMGDDLNDLPALRIAGMAIAPANAVSPEVCTAAHWTTPRAGGAGAVRDAVEAILRARGDWDRTLSAYLESLTPNFVNPLQ